MDDQTHQDYFKGLTLSPTRPDGPGMSWNLSDTEKWLKNKWQSNPSSILIILSISYLLYPYQQDPLGIPSNRFQGPLFSKRTLDKTYHKCPTTNAKQIVEFPVHHYWPNGIIFHQPRFPEIAGGFLSIWGDFTTLYFNPQTAKSTFNQLQNCPETRNSTRRVRCSELLRPGFFRFDPLGVRSWSKSKSQKCKKPVENTQVPKRNNTWEWIHDDNKLIYDTKNHVLKHE